MSVALFLKFFEKKIVKTHVGTVIFPMTGSFITRKCNETTYTAFIVLSVKEIVNSTHCHCTVSRQTQKIKNVYLKRRFKFAGEKNYKLKTPSLLPGKS